MTKKGNRPVANAHFHKHWNPTGSQKGHVRCFFSQGPQKFIRRNKRFVKAKRVFPKPVKPLKPIVRCPTQRYNMRTRLGRGFTYLELRTAGIKNHRYAQSIGLAVDKRRRNHSEEGLALNVERIKAYMSKLVVLPMNPVKKLRKVCKRSVEKKVESAKKPADSKKTKKASEKLKSWNEKKKGIIEKAKEERKKAKTEKPTEKPKEVRTQVKDPNTILPKPRSYGTDALKPEPPRQMTDLEKKRLTFQFLRKVQRDARNVGKRLKYKAKREAKAGFFSAHGRLC